MVSKSNTKAESQKSKARTAASSKKTQRTKKTVIEPKIQEANNAKSTAKRSRSKQTDDPALKTQATKKVKSPNAKASSTTIKPTKQANSKTKVLPTKRAKAAGQSSSTTNKGTQNTGAGKFAGIGLVEQAFVRANAELLPCGDLLIGRKCSACSAH